MTRIAPLTLIFTLASLPAAAQSQFYLGGSIGSLSVNTEFDDPNLDFDDDTTSWSVHAGVQATDWFGVEASYNDFGEFDALRNFDLTRTTVVGELTGYDVMAVLSAPLGPLRFFGKGGVVYWDADAFARIEPPVGAPIELRDSDDGTDLAFGGGLEFSLGENLALRAEVEWFDIDSTESVWFSSLGLSVRF